MTQLSSRRRRTVTVKFNDVDTEVIVFAKRGQMLYGIFRTVGFNVFLAKVIDVAGEVKQMYEYEAKKTLSEYLHKKGDQGGHYLDNYLRVSTGCFLSNNQLKGLDGLEDELVELTKELFETVPTLVRYDTKVQK